MKDLTPRVVLQKINASFQAVFSGDATPQQFISAFLTLLTVTLIVVFFFILIT